MKGLSERTLDNKAYFIGSFISWLKDRDISKPEEMSRKDIDGYIRELLISDINFEDKSLLIREGKGKRDRRVPVTDRSLFWLKEYLKVRASPEDGFTELLFLTDYGTRIDGSWLGTLIGSYVQKSDW